MRKRILWLISLLLGSIALLVGVWISRLLINDIRLPRGEPSAAEVIIVDSEGEVVERAPVDLDAPIVSGGELGGSEAKKIMITDGLRHSVPLEEIIGGGPPRDGIPSIDRPKFISAEKASGWLSDEEPGIAVSLDGANRFYPFQILVWHEIVNDTFPAPPGQGGASRRVLVTYCPLCLSGIVFDPLVQGERVEFGTSGKLWNSNLVMYDRKTETLWSQVLGEAIAGELTGTRLKVLPSDQLRFGNWRAAHLGGEVLSKSTGAARIYGIDPYGDYYTSPGVYFPISARDDRLEEKDFILGIVINGKAKAYFPPAIKERGEITDEFQGKTIVGRYEKELDVVRLFSAEGGSSPLFSSGEAGASGGEKRLERINPFGAFWFSWVAAHPDTELFK